MAFVPWCAQWQHGVVAEMQTDAAAIEKLAMRPSATQRPRRSTVGRAGFTTDLMVASGLPALFWPNRRRAHAQTMGACVDVASGHKRRRTEIVSWRLGKLRCPSLRKIFLFPPSSGPRSSAGYALHGRSQSRLGSLARNGDKKSLTTGRHASRLHFDAGG